MPYYLPLKSDFDQQNPSQWTSHFIGFNQSSGVTSSLNQHATYKEEQIKRTMKYSIRFGLIML